MAGRDLLRSWIERAGGRGPSTTGGREPEGRGQRGTAPGEGALEAMRVTKTKPSQGTAAPSDRGERGEPGSSPRSPRCPHWDVPSLITALAVLGVHLWLALRAPVLSYGDSSLVYLPFARVLHASGPEDAYPILTSLGRIPVYPHVAALGWALEPASGRPILLLNTVFLSLSFLLTYRLLARLGMARYAGVVFIAYGLEQETLAFSWRVGPDSLMLLIGLIYLSVALEGRLTAASPSSPSSPSNERARWRWLGWIAALGTLTRFFPLGYALAFHVLEWTSRKPGARGWLSASWDFYSRLGLGVIVGCLPITLYLLPQGFIYPVLNLPGADQAVFASESAFGVVGRILRQVFWERPLELLDLLLHPALLPVLIAGTTYSFAQKPIRLLPSATALLLVLPLFLLHFEARYYNLATWAFAVVLSTSVASVVERWSDARAPRAGGLAHRSGSRTSSRWGLKAGLQTVLQTGLRLGLEAGRQWGIRWVVLASLFLLAYPEVRAASARLEAQSRLQAQNEQDCNELRAEAPPGSLVLMRKPAFGSVYGCAFGVEPAYGFVGPEGLGRTASFIVASPDEPWLSEALRARIAFQPTGRVHPMRTGEAPSPGTAEGVPLEGPELPYALRSPSWKFHRRQHCRDLEAGRHRARVRLEEAEIPIWIRVRFEADGAGPREVGPWYLPAVDGTYELELARPKKGRLCLELGPLHRKWPAGETKVAFITTYVAEGPDPLP